MRCRGRITLHTSRESGVCTQASYSRLFRLLPAVYLRLDIDIYLWYNQSILTTTKINICPVRGFLNVPYLFSDDK